MRRTEFRKRTLHRGTVLLVVAVIVVVWALSATALNWDIEVAENGKQFSGMTDRSLCLDGQGHPHIAYGKDCLYYAFHDGSAWQYEVADSSYVVGAYASLALDGSGYPHISYHHGYPNYDLKYAYRDPSGWHTETVDAAGDYNTSLALDASGHPHISYHGNNALKYAYRDAAGWHYETLATSLQVGLYTSLALDGSGYPRISYSDSADCELVYAYRDASGWHTETVDSLGVGYTSLALDGSGWARISYRRYLGVRYAYRDASGWHTETVDGSAAVGHYTSLALDQSGWPHISYYGSSNLKYAYREAIGWHRETVDALGQVGEYTSLALDASGYPHISYHDETSGDLKYACAMGQTPLVLTASLVGGQLVLSWTAAADPEAYWVYGAGNEAYFQAGSGPGYQHRLVVLSPLFRTWSSPNGVGDPTDNWTYLVLAVDATEQELCRSNRVGEFDFGMTLRQGSGQAIDK